MRIGLTLLVLGAGLLTAFQLTGSLVDSNGVLREPFPLLPIGWLFVALGLVWTLVAVIRKRRR